MRVGVTAAIVASPALRGLRAEGNGTAGKDREILLLLCRRGRGMPGVEDRGNTRLGRLARREQEKADQQCGHARLQKRKWGGLVSRARSIPRPRAEDREPWAKSRDARRAADDLHWSRGSRFVFGKV